MQYSKKSGTKACLILGLTFAVVMLAAVACGSAAQETTTTETAAPVPTQAAAAPTAVPEATAAPEMMADMGVHPGKVTWLFPSMGNERFDTIHSGGPTKNFKQFVNASVVDVNEDMELIPGVANEWGVSSDGFSWWFDFDLLETGDVVKFHDGSPVTMEDILWTFNHDMGKGCVLYCTNTYLPDAAKETKSIEQTGPFQMTITHDVPYSGFVISPVSAALSRGRGIVPKRAELWDTQQELDFDKNPMWAGKMSFIEHVPAERISLERFDEFYYQPANGFPEDRRMKYTLADLLVVPEEATRSAALRAGEADVGIISLETKDQVEAGGGTPNIQPRECVLVGPIPPELGDGSYSGLSKLEAEPLRR